MNIQLYTYRFFNKGYWVEQSVRILAENELQAKELIWGIYGKDIVPYEGAENTLKLDSVEEVKIPSVITWGHR